MTLAKAEAWANKTFISQTSLTIVTYDLQNILLRKPQALLIKLFSGCSDISAKVYGTVLCLPCGLAPSLTSKH
jgi:hypothetical protein